MPKYACPRCDRSDQIIVSAFVSVRLNPSSEGGSFETEIEGGDHEFDDGAPCHCGACLHSGSFGDFSGETGAGSRVSLLSTLRRFGAQSGDIDEIVHEAFDGGASSVNNQGVSAQIEALLAMGFAPADLLQRVVETIVSDGVSVEITQVGDRARPTFSARLVDCSQIREGVLTVQDDSEVRVTVRLADVVSVQRAA